CTTTSGRGGPCCGPPCAPTTASDSASSTRGWTCRSRPGSPMCSAPFFRPPSGERLGRFAGGWALPFPSRIAHVFRTFLRHRRAIVLAALLVLDGDQVVRILPAPVGTTAALAAAAPA